MNTYIRIKLRRFIDKIIFDSDEITLIRNEMGRLRARIEKLESAENERKIYGKHT